jgi:hypothetical protein
MEAFVNQIRAGSDMFNERTGSASCRRTNLVKCLGKGELYKADVAFMWWVSHLATNDT